MVYFNHRYGCAKCFGVGIYDINKHRTYFSDFNQSIRTDVSFRNRLQPIHHREKSILEDLTKTDGSPLIDMVKQFPTSDPLHLLHQGVMKRMLHIWTKGTSIHKQKWSKDVQLQISTGISFWNKEFPSDINRKLRSLQFVHFFKATEFRTILLYLGIVAFKDVLDKKNYTHFLQLSLAVRLCSCRTYVDKQSLKKVARRLFSEYCANFVRLYGDNEVVSNIHNICHISDDVHEYGSLPETSTYPFENYLRDIKLRVQPTIAPIKQITRRLVEISLDMGTNAINFDIRKLENIGYPELKYEFKISNQTVYKFIRITPNVFFSVKKSGDKWFLTKTGDIVEMRYATFMNNSYFICGAPIKEKNDFFSEPYSSRLTDIYASNGEKGDEKMFEFSEIKSKLMCLSYQDIFVFIPVLHSIDECKEFF